MRSIRNRVISNIISYLLLLAILLSYIPTGIIAAPVSGSTYSPATDHYSDYSTITVIESIGGCPAMQGLALDGTYLYAAKVDDGDTTATLIRTNKTTGESVYLTNGDNGTNYFYQLAHANDLAYAEIDGVKTLFVATGGAGVGEYSLVRLALNGTTATEVGHYNVKYDGTGSYLAGVKVKSVNENDVELIFKRSKYIFSGSVGINATSGDVNVDLVCTLDLANSRINGSTVDLSAWVQQGFGYIDNKIIVPLSGNHDAATTNSSLIMVYDIEGVSGTIKNDPSLSFQITSSTYLDLFEIESCQIDPSDGKLYFNTNRRKTSSDGNHDGVHYVNDFIYDPARGDTDSSVYRWEVIDDQLTSVTDDGAIFNAPSKKGGYISDGTFNSARYYLSRSVVLSHDKPWVLEWRNTGGWSSGALLFSNNAKGAYEGNRFLYRRQNSSVIALGEYSDGTYHNYGIELAAVGIDGTVSHTYTLKNRIASDGSNMVYLFVDGIEIGPMNNYFQGGTSQGTTSDWISGKDLTFSYLGSMGHPIRNCAIDYIQVWGNGYVDQHDEPNIFRWETNSTTVSTVAQTGYTTDPVSVLSGTCTDGVLSGYRAVLDEGITLLHDRPWSIEWQCDSWSGGSMLFSSHERGKTVGAPYIYRNGSIVSLGYFDGTNYNNHGIKLADHGIDPSAKHTYRLTNRISANGSNMVYLFIDGTEIGPMDGYFVGSTAQDTTSDWISGQDFSFPYLGTLQFPISSPLSYIQVWEGGIPQDKQAQNYRWETTDGTLTNVSTSDGSTNIATALSGSCSGTTFSDSFFALENSIVLLHDRAWSIQWQSEGTWKDSSNGAMLLSASLLPNQPNAPYLYRRSGSTFIAFGERADGAHQNYGVSLSDHGIDGTVDHTYQLVNRVASDGSNMVYLFVDGSEIGPMNEYFLGGTAQGTTSDWVCGKDFVFSYLGTPQFPIGNCSIDYIQINEDCSHSFSSWTVTQAATCTTEGYQTRSCMTCGHSETETVAATGHSYTSVVTAPTCTSEGCTTYTCNTCADSYTGNTVAATGHSYSGGTCTVCGAVDPDAVTDPGLTLKYPSLSFEDEIFYNVYFTVGDMTSVEEMGLMLLSSRQTDATIDDAIGTVPGYTTNGTIYMVRSEGIAAAYMGDTVYFKVYAKLSDGTYAYSTAGGYNAKAYANTVLSGSYTDEMKSLVVAMVNYGAEAQLYFGHNTTALVNAALTDEQKALVASYDETMVDAVVSADSSKTANFVRVSSNFKSLYPSVSFDSAFSINFYCTPAITVDDGMTLYYWDAETYNSITEFTVDNATGSMEMTATNGQYWGNVPGIAAKDMDKTYYVSCVFQSEGETITTGIIAYSLGKYCEGKAATDGDAQQAFAQATAVYGYYAKQYFASIA